MNKAPVVPRVSRAVNPASQILTTGQAAGLCGVKSDTVLKWIKSGQLPAVRTAGGHYRVGLADLSPFLFKSRAGGGVASPPGAPVSQPLRCWEYLCQQGAVRDECRKCVVYQIHATWCFQVAELAPGLGLDKQFCGISCEDCPYYRRVKGLATNVLVITSDQEFLEKVSAEPEEHLALCFARTAYQASAILSSFRPAFVVVDEETTMAEQTGLLRCLSSDPRVPGLRIILAVRPGKGHARSGEAAGEAVAVLPKPFGAREIAAVVGRFPVEPLETPAEDLAPH